MEDRIALDPITIRVARDHLVGSALRTGSHYLETSNSLAPLAPLIPQAYPRTQFIVLHRHPRDFIVSGLRRSFYREGLLDHTRLRLQEDTWDDLSQVEKIALLWEMTYAHIDVAVRLYPHVPVLEIKAEDMWTDPAVIGRIAHFLDVPQPRNRRVARSQRKPVNAQTSGAVGDVTANEIEAAIATHCTSAPARGYEN